VARLSSGHDGEFSDGLVQVVRPAFGGSEQDDAVDMRLKVVSGVR
jgi:hypothetical protein